MTNTHNLVETFEETLARIQAQAEARIEKLQQLFSEKELANIDLQNSYVTSHLLEVANDLHLADREGYVFELSLGKELKFFLTPDQVLERFAADLPFSNTMNDKFDIYSLVTPAEAIEQLEQKLQGTMHPCDVEPTKKAISDIQEYASSNDNMMKAEAETTAATPLKTASFG